MEGYNCDGSHIISNDHYERMEGDEKLSIDAVLLESNKGSYILYIIKLLNIRD